MRTRWVKTSSVSSQRKLVYGNTNHLKLDSIGEKENSVLGKLPELTNGHRGLVAVVFIKVACLFGSAKAKASLIATNMDRSCRNRRGTAFRWERISGWRIRGKLIYSLKFCFRWIAVAHSWQISRHSSTAMQSEPLRIGKTYTDVGWKD